MLLNLKFGGNRPLLLLLQWVQLSAAVLHDQLDQGVLLLLVLGAQLLELLLEAQLIGLLELDELLILGGECLDVGLVLRVLVL